MTALQDMEMAMDVFPKITNVGVTSALNRRYPRLTIAVQDQAGATPRALQVAVDAQGEGAVKVVQAGPDGVAVVAGSLPRSWTEAVVAAIMARETLERLEEAPAAPTPVATPETPAESVGEGAEAAGEGGA